MADMLVTRRKFTYWSACLLLLTLLLVGMQTGFASDDRSCATPKIITDTKFQPGQVWSYKTRARENDSTITILRIESTPKLGVIVHVRIDGIQFKNCSGGHSPTSIQHAPFSKSALDRSVTRQLKTNVDIPDYSAGYREWSSHCGGVYTISIAQMLDVDDATFASQTGCGTASH